MIGATEVFALGVIKLSCRENVTAFDAGLADRHTPPSEGTPMPADCTHHRKQQP
jgi:hypothetical protein